MKFVIYSNVNDDTVYITTEIDEIKLIEDNPDRRFRDPDQWEKEELEADYLEIVKKVEFKVYPIKVSG